MLAQADSSSVASSVVNLSSFFMNGLLKDRKILSCTEKSAHDWIQAGIFPIYLRVWFELKPVFSIVVHGG